MLIFSLFLTRCLANFYILQSYRLKKVSNLNMFFFYFLCVMLR